MNGKQKLIKLVGQEKAESWINQVMAMMDGENKLVAAIAQK